MKEILINEEMEDLQLKGLKIIQKKQGFRFGMEAVLLSDFARISSGDRVADLGCGNGILPLLLWGREKGSFYYGFDIREEAAELAERNAALNGMEKIMKVFHAGAAQAPGMLGEIRVDAVVSNPPWFSPGTGSISPNGEINDACHQRENTLNEFLQAAYRILRRRGRIFLVYPAEGILTLFDALRQNRLEPKRFRLVYPSLQHPAKMLLTEAVRDGRPGLVSMKPMIIQTSDGSLTNELRSVYHMDEQTEVSFNGERIHDGE